MKKDKKKKSKNTNKKSNRGDVSLGILRPIIFLIAVIAIILLSLYISNEKVKTFIDYKILKRVTTEESLQQIILNDTRNSQIIVSDKNVHVLTAGELVTYDKSGGKRGSDILSVGNVISANEGNYMVIAEKDGRKIFFYEKGKLKWKKEIEININQVTVSREGYVIVVGKSSLYKAEVVLIDKKSEEILKKYFAKDFVVKTDISSDSKNIAIASVNYSKLLVSTKVEIISIANAIKKPREATIKTYDFDKILINMAYKGKDSILAQFNDEIQLIKEDKHEKVFDISDEHSFVNINIQNGFCVVEKLKSNIFAYNYQLRTYGINGNPVGLLVLGEHIPREVLANKGIILVEVNDGILVVRSNGWLKKKHKSDKESLKIEFSDSIAGIIYKDRIDILEY